MPSLRFSKNASFSPNYLCPRVADALTSLSHLSEITRGFAEDPGVQCAKVGIVQRVKNSGPKFAVPPLCQTIVFGEGKVPMVPAWPDLGVLCHVSIEPRRVWYRMGKLAGVNRSPIVPHRVVPSCRRQICPFGSWWQKTPGGPLEHCRYIDRKTAAAGVSFAEHPIIGGSSITLGHGVSHLCPQPTGSSEMQEAKTISMTSRPSIPAQIHGLFRRCTR